MDEKNLARIENGLSVREADGNLFRRLIKARLWLVIVYGKQLDAAFRRPNLATV